jgi:hypothetical protein
MALWAGLRGFGRLPVQSGVRQFARTRGVFSPHFRHRHVFVLLRAISYELLACKEGSHVANRDIRCRTEPQRTTRRMALATLAVETGIADREPYVVEMRFHSPFLTC